MLSAADRLVWNWHKVESAEDDLRAVKEPERGLIYSAVAAALEQDAEVSQKELPDLVWSMGVKLVDLNGDGVPEAIVQGSGFFLCGATGNCWLRVFEKHGAEYRVILHPVGEYQGFTIEEIRSHGYHELVLNAHDSSVRQIVVVYKFRTGEYHATNCYLAEWEIFTKRGEQLTLKEPRISGGKCANP